MHAAKTHLSQVVKLLEYGESVILCRRNEPIAEIRALPSRRTEPRPLGLARGLVTIHPGFFEPLPEDLQRLFDGKGT